MAVILNPTDLPVSANDSVLYEVHVVAVLVHLSVDAGVVLSIPIRRVAINVSPGYHYLFTEELNRQRQPVRNHFSISFGLACLF